MPDPTGTAKDRRPAAPADPADVIGPLVQYAVKLGMALARSSESRDQADTEAALETIESMIRLLRDARHRLLFESRALQARGYQDVVDKVGGKP